MTAVVDRIDSAADRIKDDEFLADKKRVGPLFFFFWLQRYFSFDLFDDATNIRHAVRIVQTRQSPARRVVLSVQEALSFTLPFPQRFHIYFTLALSSLFLTFSRCLIFVFFLFHFFAVTAKLRSCHRS